MTELGSSSVVTEVLVDPEGVNVRLWERMPSSSHRVVGASKWGSYRGPQRLEARPSPGDMLGCSGPGVRLQRSAPRLSHLPLVYAGCYHFLIDKVWAVLASLAIASTGGLISKVLQTCPMRAERPVDVSSFQ